MLENSWFNYIGDQRKSSKNETILSPTLTEIAAIVSSACGNQIFHPPKMPVSQGKVNGHVVTLLRDTGCSGVVIKRELVKDEQLNGKSQLCV